MVVTIEPGKLPMKDVEPCETDLPRDIRAPVSPFPQGIPQYWDSD